MCIRDRVYKNPKKKEFKSKFAVTTELDRAIAIEKRYMCAQSNDRYKRSTPAKKKINAAKKKVQRAEEKTKREGDNMNIRLAKESLENEPGNPEKALVFLRMVGKDQPPMRISPYSYRVPTEWGFQQFHLVDAPTADKEGVLARLKAFSRFLKNSYEVWHKHFLPFASLMGADLSSCSRAEKGTPVSSSW